MKTERVKGFNDYTGEGASRFSLVRDILKEIFTKYNFEEAQTPVIEYEEFVRGENPDDEAVSDIYKLKDKGGRKLALRYEFTFQLRRIMKDKKLPYKRYQIGPVFRDEPVGQNRFRQFNQCEVDIIGSSAKDEAEILSLVKNILGSLKIPSVIYINSRKLLNQVLDEARVLEKNKKQVLREIDKLDKLSEKEVIKNLRKLGEEKIFEIIKKPRAYFKKYSSFKEIEELERFCSFYGVKVVFAPFLVRGLSYYDGMVFEVKAKKIKESIFGGGSYTFNNVRSIGFGVSIERLIAVTKEKLELEKVLVVSLEKDKKAIEIAKKLRQKKQNVSVFYGKPSKALSYANSYNYNKVIFVGEKEVKSNRFKIKDMKSGKEKMLKI